MTINNLYKKIIWVGSILLIFAVPAFSQSITTCGTTSCTHEGHSQSLSGESVMLQAQANDFFTNLFDTSLWPPRWHCGSWSDFHGWFYILSDIGIWAAYFAIPLILGFFLYKKRAGMPFPGIFLLFIAFILACGLTHLVDAVIFWVPIYKFSAFIRFITAVVSIGTVFALIKIAPKVMDLRSPEHLEKIVEERTDALEKSNEKLANEIREKEAARLESKLLIESLPLIAWVTDPSGNTTYMNSRWNEYTGKEGYDDNTFNEVMHPAEKEMIWKKWSHAVSSGTDYLQEQRFLSKEGIYQWFLVKGIAMRDNDEKISRWIGTCTNIEEQKRNEQRKDTFLNIASHELKTPLTSVKAYLELLKEMFAEMKYEPIPTYLDKAYNNANKLNKLIAELLNVSRIQAGKMELKKQHFNLDDVVKDVAEIYQHNNGNHEIVVNGEIGKSVLADKDRIEQVVNNLISNAIKYSTKGNQVLINLVSANSEVRVEVQDFGMGISPEEQAKLFQQFYRSENASRSADGLGMGLYISQEIAKAHGGKIEVQSHHDTGSVFTLVIPV